MGFNTHSAVLPRLQPWYGEGRWRWREMYRLIPLLQTPCSAHILPPRPHGFVMSAAICHADKLELYYISICCWEAWNLCAFSTSSIRYQSLLALRPRHTLNRFWMDLVRAEGPDPSFAVRGFSSRFKSSPVSCNIVVLSARNPARSLIGWEAGGSGISESLQRICGCCSGFSRCQ